jgi:hypothetical protein
MKKRKKKEREAPKKMALSEETGKILDPTEFIEGTYVDWGNPLGTKPIKSKSKQKSKEIKNI